MQKVMWIFILICVLVLVFFALFFFDVSIPFLDTLGGSPGVGSPPPSPGSPP